MNPHHADPSLAIPVADERHAKDLRFGCRAILSNVCALGKPGLLGIYGSVIAAGMFGTVAAPCIIRLLPLVAPGC